MHVVVEEFLRDPNCSLSIFPLINSNSQSATKRSHVLDKDAVSEMARNGRKSLVTSLGVLFLGTGMDE